MLTTRLRRVLLAAPLLLLAACGMNLTKENYDKLELGMSPKQAEKILGAGKKVDSGGVGIGKLSIEKTEYKWECGGKVISATFVNDRLITKSQTGL